MGSSCGNDYVFKVFEKTIKGVRIILIKQEEIFNKIYPHSVGFLIIMKLGHKETLRLMVSYSKVPLMIMAKLNLTNNMIVTNDWTSGLAAAYYKHTDLGHLIPVN